MNAPTRNYNFFSQIINSGRRRRVSSPMLWSRLGVIVCPRSPLTQGSRFAGLQNLTAGEGIEREESFSVRLREFSPSVRSLRG